MNYLQNIGDNNPIKEEMEVETKMKQKTKKGYKKENSGITLVALVVTIVVLLILAGITITALFSENGIIKKAQEAKNKTEQDQIDTANGINSLIDQMNEQLGIEKTYSITDEAVTKIAEKTIKVIDNTGKNTITLPKGFKIKEGTSVQQGIVIEDKNGNQFVWIPVGKVTKDDGSESNEIKLGRYTFSTSSPGNPSTAEGSYQYAYTEENPKNYENEVTINSRYKELKDPREGVESSGADGLNTTAKDLAGFVDSVAKNGGYYLARYEASYGGGYEPSGSDDKAKYGKAKPLSQPSIEKSESSMTYDTSGKLWNFISELNASRVCKNMYTEVDNVGVESDLVNSYAWDTAIVYIQEMGHTDYVNKKDGNGTLKNTGKTNDEVCKINDMGSNLAEWTTEYSIYSDGSIAIPCVYRGGCCNNSSTYYTAYRYSSRATASNRLYRLPSTTLCKVALNSGS